MLSFILSKNDSCARLKKGLIFNFFNGAEEAFVWPQFKEVENRSWEK